MFHRLGAVPLKIVALDIATQCGIAVGIAGRDPRCWSVDLGKGRSEDARFSQALTLTHGLIHTHKPDLLVVEAFIGGKHASAYLIGLVACVRGCAANQGVKCEMVFPATVRKHFVERAKTSRDFPHLKPAAAKLAIKREVLAQCRSLNWKVDDLDAADAAATWDWACTEFVPGYQAAPHGGLFK